MPQKAKIIVTTLIHFFDQILIHFFDQILIHFFDQILIHFFKLSSSGKEARLENLYYSVHHYPWDNILDKYKY